MPLLKFKVLEPIVVWDEDCNPFQLVQVFDCNGNYLEPGSEELAKPTNSNFEGDGRNFIASYFIDAVGGNVLFADSPSPISLEPCDGSSGSSESCEAEPGYRSLTGTSSWTPPANVTSVTVTVARGSVAVTTPNGSGTMWNRTSQTWEREDFGTIGWGNFQVQGLAANTRIQIGFMICS